MTQDSPTPPPIDPVPSAGTAQPIGYGSDATYPKPGMQYDGPPPTQDEKTMGMLCHLLGVLTFWVGPLILWLVKKDQSRWIDDQGKEALNFQIVASIASFICLPFMFCVPIACVTLPLFAAVQIARLTFSIIACVQANQGIAYRYPVTLRMVK